MLGSRRALLCDICHGPACMQGQFFGYSEKKNMLLNLVTLLLFKSFYISQYQILRFFVIPCGKYIFQVQLIWHKDCRAAEALASGAVQYCGSGSGL